MAAVTHITSIDRRNAEWNVKHICIQTTYKRLLRGLMGMVIKYKFKREATKRDYEHQRAHVQVVRSGSWDDVLNRKENITRRLR